MKGEGYAKGGKTYKPGDEVDIKITEYQKTDDDGYHTNYLEVYQHPTKGVWITSENGGGDIVEHSKGKKGKKEVEDFIKRNDWQLVKENVAGTIELEEWDFEEYAKGGKVLTLLTLKDFQGTSNSGDYDEEIYDKIKDRKGTGSVYSFEEKLTENPNRKDNGLASRGKYNQGVLSKELDKLGKNAKGEVVWNFIQFNYPSTHKYRKLMKDAQDIENFDGVIGSTDKEATKHKKIIDKLITDKQLKKDWRADTGGTQQHWYEKGGEIDKNLTYKGDVVGFKDEGTGRAFLLGEIDIPKNSTPIFFKLFIGNKFVYNFFVFSRFFIGRANNSIKIFYILSVFHQFSILVSAWIIKLNKIPNNFSFCIFT